VTRTNFPALLSSGAAIIALALAGCSSDLPSGENTSPVAEFKIADQAALQDALLSKIGRGLALALADPATRAWLRSRIDASPYVEWRIPFRDLLLREAGIPQMRRALESTRLTAVERDRQTGLPPLELYFPIPEHRTGWKASAPVQVAVRIGHGDTYTLYSTDGTASVSRGDQIPATATLVLAVSEIDYSDLPSAVRGGSRTGPGMLALAQRYEISATALPPPYEPPPPPPPSGGATTSRHTRLGSFRTTRYHDDFLGGHDEVEIYGSVHGGFKECTWRTDVSPNRDYFLDVASSFSTIATAIPWGTATVFIEAFEDDDGRCVRRSSDDRYGSTFLNINQYETMFGTSNPGHIAVRVHSVLP
jgi:hypothetical protein